MFSQPPSPNFTGYSDNVRFENGEFIGLEPKMGFPGGYMLGGLGGAKSFLSLEGLTKFWNGGKTFAQLKNLRGGTKTLTEILTSTGKQRISTEFHHVFIPQRWQKLYNLPNWLVNNRVNVWKLNTIQHSLIDSFRFNFLRKGFKSEVGWFKKYNWFTKF